MNYLLVNHVPLGRTASPHRFCIGDMWLEDLRAQSRAIRRTGGRLLLAAPCVDELSVDKSGSFEMGEFCPEAEEIEYIPLPHYQSLKRYLRVHRELRARLTAAVERASIVQADYGGYPLSLGQVVWPIAGQLHRRRIWVFDGADPFPRMELAARQEKNVLKRWGKQWMRRRFESFCRRAIHDADLVFSHNKAVADRFEQTWHSHCYLFYRSLIQSDMILSETQMTARNAMLTGDGLPLRLLTVGRQIRIKGTDHILRAMAAAREQGVELRLDVVGDGEAMEDFQRLTRQLKLEENVRFLGTVPYGAALFEVCDAAHAMVITNVTPEISRNVTLGMARGLPLIIYRNAATDPLIDGYEAGVLVPSGDIAALAATFVEVSHNRHRLAQAAENALAAARGITLDACHQRRAALALACLEEKSERLACGYGGMRRSPGKAT